MIYDIKIRLKSISDLKIKRSGLNKRENSRLALLKESFRRLQLWDKVLDLQGKYDRYHHIFDVANAVNPNWEYDLKNDDELFRELRPISVQDRYIISWFVNWELHNEYLSEHYDISNPFAPLIKMCEREGGFLNFIFKYHVIEFYSVISVPINDLKEINYDIAVILEDSYLDDLDRDSSLSVE